MVPIGSSPLIDRVEAQIQVSPYPRREYLLWHCWPNWTRSYRIIQCPCMYPLYPILSPPCLTAMVGDPNRHAPRISSQRPQFRRRLLRGLAPRRRPPTYQRHLVRLLSSPPSPLSRLCVRRNQYFAQDPFDSQHATREHTRHPHHPRARGLHHNTFTRCFAYHPYLLAYAGPNSSGNSNEIYTIV